MKNSIHIFIRDKKLYAGILLFGSLFIAQSTFADPCRLSIVLDRTRSMLSAIDPTEKCSIARDFTIGVVQGFINGNDVSIIPGSPADPTNPLINAGFYSSCTLSERKVEIITFSGLISTASPPSSLTSGFVDPTSTALAQLKALEATDKAGTTFCTRPTQLADALCVAADSLRAEAPNFSDVRKMKIVTDGSENSSDINSPLTTCEGPDEPTWISNTLNKLLIGSGGVSIAYDAVLLTDTFFSSAAQSGGHPNASGEVSGLGKLTIAEENFLATIALNTGGTVNRLEKAADAAGVFTSPNGGGIDLCGGDIDKDFDVDNLDALLFSKDFNNPACQISP